MNTPLNSPEQLERLREVVGAVCAAHGLSLVDARFVVQRGTVLKVLIERLGTPDGNSGVTLADCQDVSRDLSTALDVESEAAPTGAYRLEVSSPGLERPLLSRQDFERFAGREAKVKTRLAIGERKSFQGVLCGVEELDGHAVVEMRVEGQQVAIPLHAIAKAHLVFKF